MLMDSVANVSRLSRTHVVWRPHSGFHPEAQNLRNFEGTEMLEWYTHTHLRAPPLWWTPAEAVVEAQASRQPERRRC